MRKAASRIAVDASSRGRWYPDTPPEGGNSNRRRRLVPITRTTQRRAECAIFARHECAVFVRR